jgi:hypothetical protein
MKKIFVSVLILIFTIISLSAQKKKDVLYLKNGSSIYGKLIEVNDSQYKIQTADGSIFIYSSSEVEKFINETPLFEGRKKSGIGIAMEAGFLVGAQSSEYKSPFSFNIIANMTANTRNIFGIGSGVEYLGKPFTPFFLEYKYLFSSNKSAPFIFFRGGKLFHLKGDTENNDFAYPQYNYRKSYEGGATFAIGTGVSWVKEDGETYLSFAYRYAQTSYEIDNYNNLTEKYKNSFNRLEVKIGFKF